MKHPEDLFGGRNANQTTNNNISHPKADESSAQKRSKVMKSSNASFRLAMRGLFAILLIAAITQWSIGQNVTVSSDQTSIGKMNINGKLINNKSSGNATVSLTGGQVIMKGATTTTVPDHEFKSNGSAGFSIEQVVLVGSRPTTLGTATTVTTAFQIGDGTNGYTAGSGFDIKDKTLTLGGTVTYDNTNNSNSPVAFGSGVVAYSSTSTQTLLNRTAGVTYGTLNLTGNGGAYIFPASVPQTAATVSQTVSGTVTFNESLDITGTGSLKTIADVAAGKVVDFKGTSSSSSIVDVTAVNATGKIRNSGSQDLSITTVTNSAGTIEHTGSAGTLSVTTLTANTGTIQTAGAGNLSLSTVNGNSGTIQHAGTAAATLTITTLNANTGTIQTTGAGNISVTGAAANNGIVQATAPSTGKIIFASDLSGAGTVTLAGASTVEYAGTVTQGGYSYASGSTARFKGTNQTIPGTTYYTLDLANSSTNSLAASTDIKTALTASSGSPNVTIAGATNLEATATADIKGNLTLNDALTAAGTVTLSGASQTIGGSQASVTFADLTLAGSAAKASSIDVTVNGAFTPSYGIDMTGSDKTLYVKGSVGSYGDLQEVKGKMKRDIAALSTAYKMNNEFTQVSFATAKPSDFTLKVQPGVSPTGYTAATDVNRKVTIGYTSWNSSGAATLQLAYLNSEIPTTPANEAKIRLYDATGINKVATGFAPARTASQAGTTNDKLGYLTLAGIRPSGGGSLAYAQINSGDEIRVTGGVYPFITLADNTPFGTGGTWDEGTVPSATDDATINNTGITVPSNLTVNSLTVNAGKSITLDAGNITATTVTDAGDITVNAGHLLYATTYAKTAGNTVFTGSAAITTLSMTGGSLAFNGTGGDASTIKNNVTLNAGSVSVGGTLSAVTASAGDFTLNGATTLTLPNASSVLNVGASGIASNLNLSGTNGLTISNALGVVNVFGNLNIGASAALSNNGTINVGE